MSCGMLAALVLPDLPLIVGIVTMVSSTIGFMVGYVRASNQVVRENQALLGRIEESL